MLSSYFQLSCHLLTQLLSRFYILIITLFIVGKYTLLTLIIYLLFSHPLIQLATYSLHFQQLSTVEWPQKTYPTMISFKLVFFPIHLLHR